MRQCNVHVLTTVGSLSFNCHSSVFGDLPFCRQIARKQIQSLDHSRYLRATTWVDWKCSTWNCRTKYRRFCRQKKRRNARGRTAQVRRRLVARADTPRSSCLQLLPVPPLTWKSSQSLQQVMPWLVAGRLRHLLAGRLVVVSHRLDYFLCAQVGDLSPICCDLPRSSNWSKSRHKRLLSLFRLRCLPLLSSFSALPLHVP